MSYTSEELKEIAENIEAFRVQAIEDKSMSWANDERLHHMVKDLYKRSNGIHTKEVEKKCLSRINTST
mgnify:FL=1